MRKIKNPFTQVPGYQCFGCAPNNAQGLRMEFAEDGDEITCAWTPSPHFQGYGDILHGGIQSSLLDELASWVLFIKCHTAGVTSRAELRYKKPVKVNEGALMLRGKIKEIKKRFAFVDTRLLDAAGDTCSEAMFTYYMLTETEAKEKLRFPEYTAFFET